MHTHRADPPCLSWVLQSLLPAPPGHETPPSPCNPLPFTWEGVLSLTAAQWRQVLCDKPLQLPDLLAQALRGMNPPGLIPWGNPAACAQHGAKMNFLLRLQSPLEVGDSSCTATTIKEIKKGGGALQTGPWRACPPHSEPTGSPF